MSMRVGHTAHSGRALRVGCVFGLAGRSVAPWDFVGGDNLAGPVACMPAVLFSSLGAALGPSGGTSDEVVEPDSDLGQAPWARRSDALYSEKPLGCTVGPAETVFRVFAPSATAVTLDLYDRHDAEACDAFSMARDEDGVWELTLGRALYGKYYGYRIAGPPGRDRDFDPDVVVADPYSKAVVTRNTHRHEARTLILDTSYDWGDDCPAAPGDHRRLVIYEAHLRDLTAHPSSGVVHRGTYRGMTEKGRRGGLSHLKRLGVNAVEFLPLQEFGNIEIPYRDDSVRRDGHPVNTWNPYERNHWGYMTSYFFAPESYYATGGALTPGGYSGVDGRAVREMKDMVRALHREGIAVIMDVVYNHVSQYDNNPLRLIDRRYYFRRGADGDYLALSGCGNDLRTEAPMARRLIVDSIVHWMTEYHVDGFRFDLAAMIDRRTLEEITVEARRINPNVILIAEPWGGGHYDPAGFSDLGWAAWNDRFRNGVKGQDPVHGPGFIFGRHQGGNTRRAERSFVTGTLRVDGGLFARPEHSLNYLESHDDHTLGDFIRLATGAAAERERVADRTRNARLTPRELALHKLAAAFLLTSQGPVMIAQGQEYARSKVVAPTYAPDPRVGRIDSNSYEKDNSTNHLDYRHLDLNRELFAYYRGLVALRRRHPVFGSAARTCVRFHETGDERVIAYRLTEGVSDFVVVLNGNPFAPAFVPLPPGMWAILADDKTASAGEPLGYAEGGVLVPETSAMILKSAEA